MNKDVHNITIVGGGDSGLITALCIKKLNPGIEISVVDDFDAGKSQIGKSTFKYIVDILHNFLEIDYETFVEEVKPVWKASVYFENWCGNDPFHFPFDQVEIYPDSPKPSSGEHYRAIYDELDEKPEYNTFNEAMVEQRKTPYLFTNDGDLTRYQTYAYHLDVHRFNAFLRKLCEERDISLIDDEITSVETIGDTIERIRGQQRAYEADLFFDASGFTRVLKRELDGDFRSFDLPLDAAFNTRIERPLSEVVPATVIETGEHGWFWQIDTYENRDVGYVFASDFVNDDEARAEFKQYCEGTVTDEQIKRYGFESGYFRNSWVNNCVTIGNAEGFVEPLQSTGLTANAQAAVFLSILMSSHGCINDRGIRRAYNSCVESIWESIYDFISVHYRYSAGESEFWKAARNIDISERTSEIIREFDENGFPSDISPEDYNNKIDKLMIFKLVSFHSIMRNMGAESVFYERNTFNVSDEVKEERKAFYESMENSVNDFLSYEEVYKGIFTERGGQSYRVRKNT